MFALMLASLPPLAPGATRRRRQTILLFGVALVISVLLIKGCEYFPESSFQLANESRLPKWITLPPGLTRADVSLTMNYYSMPFLPDAQFVLQDTKNHVIYKLKGKEKCSEPFHGYPGYKAITVNGITEIIEHKQPEPIFYVSDDPAVRKDYDSAGCG